MNDDINAMINTVVPEHKAGLLRNGEDLYTREQVVKSPENGIECSSKTI